MSKICYVEGCGRKTLARGVCNKHYKHLYRHGKIIERTIYDKNEIIMYNNFAEVKLYNKQGKYIASTLIDLEDVEKIKDYKWHLNDNGYVRSRELNEYLHRYIMNPSDDNDVDHIYQDTLDNRKMNLRECKHYENNRNVVKSNSNTGIKGVYYEKRTNKFYSSINSKGFKYTSAQYDNLEDALECREIMELYLHKEYSAKYEYLRGKYGDIDCEKFNSVVKSVSEYNMKG